MTAQLRSKSIRLDLYVTDTENNVFDVEMQTTGNRSVLYSDMDQETVIRELPLRTRYYQSIISTNMLRKGKLYGELRKSYVIFVCTFDPFGKGLPVYHFTYRCSEDCTLQMNDKTECIFLNAKAAKKAEDRELAAFLAYINGKAAKTAFTEQLDKEVNRIKSNDGWRYKIMTLDMEIEMMKRRVAEKSRRKGLQEGRQKAENEINERVATDMIKDGKPLSEILKYSKLTEATVRKLAKSMGVAVL